MHEAEFHLGGLFPPFMAPDLPGFLAEQVSARSKTVSRRAVSPFICTTEFSLSGWRNIMGWGKIVDNPILSLYPHHFDLDGIYRMNRIFSVLLIGISCSSCLPAVSVAGLSCQNFSPQSPELQRILERGARIEDKSQNPKAPPYQFNTFSTPLFINPNVIQMPAFY